MKAAIKGSLTVEVEGISNGCLILKYLDCGNNRISIPADLLPFLQPGSIVELSVRIPDVEIDPAGWSIRYLNTLEGK
ncbi:MAG: hypothetical protein WC455_11820 [Dehalococcoidia bacterium]|jgi:hypothetical protein